MEPMGIEQHRWDEPRGRMSGSERVNTMLSGSDWVDDIQGHPRGRVGRAWRTRQDVRKYATEQGISQDEVLDKGLREKAEEFKPPGTEIYSKA